MEIPIRVEVTAEAEVIPAQKPAQVTAEAEVIPAHKEEEN